jgi:uncharacterized damage-inducible protein DinB
MTEPTSNPREERDSLLKSLADGEKRYLAALEPISEETALLRRDKTSWSILECAEHVATAEGQMLRMWQKMATPGATDRANDAVIGGNVSNRGRKSQAPDPSRPKGRFATLTEARAKFVSNRQATVQFLQEMNEDLRTKTVPHPLAGIVDGYQLFLIMALHPARHAEQIEEIANVLAAKANTATSS